MKEHRRQGHTVSRLTVHIVWVTKYRFQVLKGDVQLRCRDIVKQICDSEDIHILSGVISKDQVHLQIEYRPSQKISDIVKQLKGRTSRRLQEEFPVLNKRYLGRHFWAIGYGVWSTGNITDKMVQEYLEHHRNPSNLDSDNIILE